MAVKTPAPTSLFEIPAALWAVLLAAFLATGCAAERPRTAAYPDPGSSYGPTAGATTVAANAPPAEAEMSSGAADERFASDDSDGSPSPPPAKPVRQIDRDGDAPPPVLKKPAIDRTPGDDGNGTGGQQTATQPQGPTTAAVHGTEFLIYTARLTMAVYQVGPGLDAIERIGRDVGGYLSAKTDREVTIRVPRQRFEETLKRVEGSGDVLHREVRAQDVTDEFMDLDTRLKNARAMRQRLQDLLAKAAVKEALEIEKELGRVTGEIETMEGKLKLLRDRIAFSTITVAFEARGAAAVRDMPLRLPFPWLSNLGLQRLLSLY